MSRERMDSASAESNADSSCSLSLSPASSSEDLSLLNYSNFRRRGHLKGPFHQKGSLADESSHDGKGKSTINSWERYASRIIRWLHRLVTQRCPLLLNQKCNMLLFSSLLFWLLIALISNAGEAPSTIRVRPKVHLKERNVPLNMANHHKPSIFESAASGMYDIMARSNVMKKPKKNREADDPGCVRPEWHSYNFQNCNDILSIDLREMIERGNRNKKNPQKFGFVAAGLWRSVYLVGARDPEEVSVLKIMKGEHDVNTRNFDRHRRDALVMERLTSSPNVVDIYGFCGNTVLTEFAPQPLDDLIYAKSNDGKIENPYATRLTPEGRLDLAIGTFRGLADIHEIEGGPIVHADIEAKQFLVTPSGSIKLNDFNRCRIMAHHKDSGSPCKFMIPTSPGKARSPEEYKDDKLDEKLDVYSAGHVFYGILTGRKAWYEHSTSETKHYVKEGAMPKIPDELRRPGTIDAALANLTELAYTNRPSDRISARQIVTELERVRDKYVIKAP